jgi:uncharacterized RDD family membrane protein YckC
MVATFETLGLVSILFANSAVAALLTRFLRVRLDTRWGSAVYVVFLVPVVLLALTLVLGAFFGPDLGSPAAVLGLTVGVPLTLGVAFDYFWMPAPEEVDLPDRREGDRSSTPDR